MPVNTTEERIELTAVDRASAVIGQVKQSVTGLSAGLDTVKNALGAVGLTIGAGAMVKLYADVIHATAALDDMAESTGASVENLSKFQQVAKIGGHDFEGLTGQIGKMIKGLKEGDDGSKKSAAALEYLGVKAKNANGAFRDTGDVLTDVSKALAQYQDNGNKVALIQDLLGKGAERYLPFLKDLNEESGVHAQVTKQQAAQAELLEKNINRLTLAMEKSRKELVLEFTPSLIAFTQKMLEAQKAAGGLASGAFLAATVGMSDIDTDSPARGLSTVQGRLARLRKTRDDLSAPGFTNSANEFLFGDVGDLNRQIGQLERAERYLKALKDVERQNALSRLNAGSYDARDAMVGNRYQEALESAYRSPADEKKQRGATLSDLLNQSVGVDKDFTKDLTTLHNGYAAGKVTLEGYVAAVTALIEKQEFARKLTQQHTTAAKAFLEMEEALAKASQQKTAALQTLNQAQADAAQKAEAEAAGIGLTSAQVEKANALREEDVRLRRLVGELTEKGIELSLDEVLALHNQNEAMKARIANAYDLKDAKQQALEVTKKQAEEQKRLSDQIEHSLSDAVTDGLMNGFRRGESLAQNFLRRLQELFKTAVLEPLIQPILKPFANAIAGMSGSVGSSVAGMFGFGGGGGGGFPSPGSFMNFLSPDVGSFLGGLTGGAGLSGTLMADSIMAEMVGGAAAGASGLAAGAGALSFLGPVGLGMGALALLGGGGLFGGDDNSHADPRWDPRAIEHTDPRFGGKPRTPMAGFDPEGYLAANPDVAASAYATHPYDHYVDWGQGEGRALAPPGWAEQKAAAAAAADAAKKQADAAEQLSKLVDQEERLNEQLGTLVSSLPGRLGITSIQAAMNDLSVSAYRSPLDRLNAAQDIYSRTLASARGGDIDAIGAFPDAVQSLLGIGRDVYASGPQFQSLFGGANRDLSEILGQQQAVLAGALSGVEVAVQQGAQNTNATLLKGFNETKEALDSLRREVTLLRLQAA